MKNHASFVFALVASAILAGPSISPAAVGEASALFPVTIPAKSGAVAGVKFVGIPVARPSIYEGLVTTTVAVNSNATTVFTDSGLDASALAALGNPTASTARVGTNTNFATADNQYVLEITSGANVGLTKVVSSFDANGVTVVGGFALPVEVGTKYVIRKDWTLGSLFGNTATTIAASGLSGGLASSADNIGLVRNGVLELYYWTGSKWTATRNVNAAVDYSQVRVPMSGGIYVKRNKTTAGTLYLSGIYRPTRLQALLEGADNAMFAVSTPNFKDTTLAETGLHRYVKTSTLISACDEVRVLTSAGTLQSYVNSAAPSTGAYTGGFWNGSTTNAPSWKSTRGGTAGDANNLIIPAGSAVLIKKEGAGARQLGIDPAYTE
jgi:hypothetical protein